jgi:hypothetical protein
MTRYKNRLIAKQALKQQRLAHNETKECVACVQLKKRIVELEQRLSETASSARTSADDDEYDVVEPVEEVGAKTYKL